MGGIEYIASAVGRRLQFLPLLKRMRNHGDFFAQCGPPTYTNFFNPFIF